MDEWKFSTTTDTDEQGRFELQGLFPAEVELSIDSEEWVISGPRRAPRGAQEFELVVARGGAITGSFLAEEPAELEGLSVLIFDAERFGPDESPGSQWTAWTRADANGTFAATGLEAGRYHCRVKKQGVALASVADVRVELGRTTRDPRLQNLDLALLARSVTLQVRDRTGRKLNAIARVLVDGEPRSYANGREGAVALTIPPGERVQVVLWQTGYRPIVVEHPADGQEVVLERGLEVRLVSSGRPVLERGGRSAVFTLIRVEGVDGLPTEFFQVGIPGGIAAGETLPVAFPAPGTYRLHVVVQQAVGAMVMGLIPEPLPDEILFAVREEDAGKTLEIALPESVFE